MSSLGLAFLIGFLFPSDSSVHEFGGKAGYHHDHTVDHVYVLATLQKNEVRVQCKTTKTDVTFEVPRELKFCRVNWLESANGQIKFSGYGLDLAGVVCNFSSLVASNDGSPPHPKITFFDKLANDKRFKDSEWRVKGEVVGYAANDETGEVLVMSTGRLIHFFGPGPVPLKTGTLDLPLPKRLKLKPKGKSIEIYDGENSKEPFCVLDEFFKIVHQ